MHLIEMLTGDLMRLQSWEDFNKLPKFKSYADVPVGFEIVKGNFRSNPYELNKIFELGSENCAVSLWQNTEMTFEEDWDDEIIPINGYQKKLGKLSDNTRAVRALISSYDILNYRYDKALKVILDAIKNLSYEHVVPIGPHIPWWPPNQAKRIEMMEVYISSLQAWDQKQKSLTIRTSKQFKNEVLRNVYVRLGEWTREKSNYVKLIIEKLELFSNIFTVQESIWIPSEKEQYLKLAENKLDRLISQTEMENKVNRLTDDLLIRIKDYNSQIWYHGFFKEVNLWLERIGKDVRVDFDKTMNRTDDVILEVVFKFTNGLELFLELTSRGDDIDIDDKNYQQLKKIFPVIIDEQKWLLTCLWKSMKEQLINIRKKRGEQDMVFSKNEWLFEML
jgi:hypothetical protein